jgi:hydroxyacylglutathione hydrolase
MQYTVVPVTPFQQNCSVLWCPDSREAAIVDPGGDLDRIARAVDKLGVTPKTILLTHGHVDHVAGADELRRRMGIPIVGPHLDDAFWLQSLASQSAMFGFSAAEAFEPDTWLDEGDSISVGGAALDVLHCPGHTPGHVVFVQKTAKFAIVGDVLFQGSIGRTDFPRGSYADLIRSIKTKLLPLGDDVVIVPGHGPGSTIGTERRSNPFLT